MQYGFPKLLNTGMSVLCSYPWRTIPGQDKTSSRVRKYKLSKAEHEYYRNLPVPTESMEAFATIYDQRRESAC